MIEGLSGPFADGGSAIERNLRFAIDNINRRGGVRLPGGALPFELVNFDSKSNVEEALVQLRTASDRHIPFVLQGNSSAVAAALVDALNKHNARAPGDAMLFLNYSAVDPSLTNELCSFWHFRFDAGADMRMNALTDVLADDARVKRVYIIGQDYVFGRQVSRYARELLQRKRPDIEIVGDELHPIAKIRDFSPYIAKIRMSHADAVITGNWGTDLTLLVKAAREGGLSAKFYTFYGNSLGAPAAMGDSGIGRVLAVNEWHPNVGGRASDAFVEQFRARYSDPRDDYQHLRVTVMMEMLREAIEKAGTIDATKVARALESMKFSNAFYSATMRLQDHQLIQPLYVSIMQRQGEESVRFGNEGSGYGFKTVLYLPPQQTAMPTTCAMVRP